MKPTIFLSSHVVTSTIHWGTKSPILKLAFIYEYFWGPPVFFTVLSPEWEGVVPLWVDVFLHLVIHDYLVLVNKIKLPTHITDNSLQTRWRVSHCRVHVSLSTNFRTSTCQVVHLTASHACTKDHNEISGCQAGRKIQSPSQNIHCARPTGK